MATLQDYGQAADPLSGPSLPEWSAAVATELVALRAAVGTPDANWINATLLNGWTAYSPTAYIPRYRKLPGGIVWITGLIKQTVAYTVTDVPAFNLPVGYRPLTDETHFSAGCASGPLLAGLRQSGDFMVKSSVAANMWFSVEYMFYAGA